MKNIDKLIKAEARLFEDVLAGRIDPVVASEATNAAGKIISACKVQVDYSAARGEKPDIPFLNRHRKQKGK